MQKITVMKWPPDCTAPEGDKTSNLTLTWEITHIQRLTLTLTLRRCNLGLDLFWHFVVFVKFVLITCNPGHDWSTSGQGLDRFYVHLSFFADETLLKAVAIAFNDFSSFDQMSPIAYLLEVRMTQNLIGNLRTVPTIVIVHTFCVSPDTRISYRQCLLIQGSFCAV